MTGPSHLLLLHSALGASDQFAPLLPLLARHFTVHTLDFEGHGSAPLRDRPFRIQHFAENVIGYLDTHRLNAIDLFGYSLGGYVALYLARTQPDRVSGVFTLGTKLRWSLEIAAREVKLLDAEKMRQKVPQFARTLEERHTAAGWKTVLAHTADMLTTLGAQPLLGETDFAMLPQRIRIGLGDRDTTVTLEESMAAYRALPRGELEVFPNTPHPLEKVPVERLARSVREFFASWGGVPPQPAAQ